MKEHEICDDHRLLDMVDRAIRTQRTITGQWIYIAKMSVKLLAASMTSDKVSKNPIVLRSTVDATEWLGGSGDVGL